MDIGLYGAGSLGLEVANLIKHKKLITSLGYLPKIKYVIDDCLEESRVDEILGMFKHDIQLFQSSNEIKDINKESIFITLSNPNERLKIYESLQEDELVASVSLIHKELVFFDNVKIGSSNIIFENTYIGPFSEIGSNNLINIGCSIGHDVKISNSVVISPNTVISGNCHIENCVFIGSNATINPETSIAKEITIASGAVVIKNLSQPGIYAGNPARIFKLAFD
tara:strand:+ start:3137 stop:3808 length:672 start_codon:yes stop_codon:yes gene_type:complete